MSPRAKVNLNRDWRFLRGDITGAEDPAFDDSTWEAVGLPHTFDLPYFRTPEFYVGVGWYRKRVDARAHWPGGKTFAPRLEFDGAFQTADVFVNGKHVGRHRGGYTGFCIESAGWQLGENLIAVRVSNEWDPQLAPRAGEHVFSGGLYRDVHLSFSQAVDVEWNGIAITTPTVSRESATVRVTTEVRNTLPMRSRCTVRHTVIDPDGSAVASFESTASLPPASTFTFDQTSEPIPRPRLWHPDHPHLYRLKTQVFRDAPDEDAIETTFGIRWFEWTADRGFFLNGEPLYLRGANAHQDHAGWGIAVTRAGHERDVRLIKEAGFNFVRGAHYPHHPAFGDACDRLGLLFWSENAFWGKGGFGPEGYWNASAYPSKEEDFAGFEASCKQQLAEMIRINRNHPSIIAWSMTNEAFFTYRLDRARALVSDLVKLSRELDPTRPAAVGGAQRGDMDRLGDVAGYNGDGARLFLDPGVPNLVSEYGAISKPHDAYDPFWGELVLATPESPSSHATLETGDASVAPTPERFPWRSGQAIWAGFDYGSIAGRQGLKGIVNHQRLPKRSWYRYRNEYRNVPPPVMPAPGNPAKLRLSADKTWIHGTDATDDVQLVVTVLDAAGRHVSDCPPVTLTIESGPGEFPTGPSITFDPATDIGMADGQAAIAFRSYHGGVSAVRATSPGLADATVEITTEGEPAFVPGVTPPARPRPYVPPPPSAACLAAMRNAVNVARDRPCRASSEAERHPARFANDGNADTLWAANEERAGAWWQVDLEGFYQISGGRIAFEADANYRYTVQLSDDARTWTTAIDRSQTVNTNQARDEIYPPGATARYVRLTIVDVPHSARAALREFEVHGVLSVR